MQQRTKANITYSTNTSFCNIDTSKSCDSDDSDNDTNNDCEITTSSSNKCNQASKENDNISNNGNSGQDLHWNDIRAINDHISITDKQDSISSLTTENASLTVFVHEVSDEKITTDNKTNFQFFFQQVMNNNWWAGISGKVKNQHFKCYLSQD